jgi:hypothetical protein
LLCFLVYYTKAPFQQNHDFAAILLESGAQIDPYWWDTTCLAKSERAGRSGLPSRQGYRYGIVDNRGFQVLFRGKNRSLLPQVFLLLPESILLAVIRSGEQEAQPGALRSTHFPDQQPMSAIVLRPTSAPTFWFGSTDLQSILPLRRVCPSAPQYAAPRRSLSYHRGKNFASIEIARTYRNAVLHSPCATLRCCKHNEAPIIFTRVVVIP